MNKIKEVEQDKLEVFGNHKLQEKFARESLLSPQWPI